MSWRVGSGDAYWGYFLEVGTRNMPARPWMRPTFDAAAPSLVATIEQDLRRRIEQAAAEKAAKAGA